MAWSSVAVDRRPPCAAQPPRARLPPAMSHPAPTVRPAVAAPTAARRSRALMLLWVCGLANAAICAAFAWRYPLRGHTQELADIGKLADYRVWPFVGFIAGMVGLFGFYIAAIILSRRVAPRRARWALFVCGGLQVAAMGWMYPVNAIDLFIYAVRSRLFTEYGANPLTALPRDFAHDPYMGFASQEWADNVSPYGPLWNLIAAPVTLIGGDRIEVALAGFKVLAGLAGLLGAWLIVRTVAVVRPRDAAAAGIIFLWNPLVLWEGVGNGHNDLVMMVPVLASIWAWTRGRDALVIPLLVTAATIKYVPAIAIPLAAIAVLRRAPSWRARLRISALSLVGSALVVAVAAFPFYDPAAVRESIEGQSGFFLTSPHSMVLGLLQERYGADDIKWWATRVGYGILAATVLWQAARILRRPGQLSFAMFEAMFAYLLVASSTFRGWYLIWLVGLAGLVPAIWPTARVIAWSAGAMSVYGLFIWVWHWWGADYLTIQNVAVPMIFGPAVLVTALQIGAALWRRLSHHAPPALSEEGGVPLSGRPERGAASTEPI